MRSAISAASVTPRVGFAYVVKSTEVFAGASEVGAAHGEGVVAKQAGALAVAPYSASGDDDVERWRARGLSLTQASPRRPGW